MPLACAIARIGRVTFGSSNFETLLKIGCRYTGPIITANTMNNMVTTAPQIHQVRGSFLTTQNSSTVRMPPIITPTPSPLTWSHIHGPNVCVASPYFHSRK